LVKIVTRPEQEKETEEAAEEIKCKGVSNPRFAWEFVDHVAL
jgi:hypothetical protein